MREPSRRNGLDVSPGLLDGLGDMARRVIHGSQVFGEPDAPGRHSSRNIGE